MTIIAEVPAPDRIVFGTDGWRARVADDFTFENVRRCADGVAAYVAERGEQAKGVVVAYDRRFASEHFAIAAAEVLLARGIPVAYAVQAVPTQMSSYEVVARGAAAGIVITASHNPWTDNGFKVKAASGSAAGPEILAVLEARIAANGGAAIERRPFADAEAAGLVERFDPYPGYEQFLRRTLDLDALRAADINVLVEPMWGSGAGWISRLLGGEGARIRVTEIHRERNPYFGGVNPEPIRPHIDEALAMLAGGGFDLGLLLDGDADRAGAADERGVFIHQLQVFGLLMYYLVEHRGLRAAGRQDASTRRRWRSGSASATASPVHETPVGFKYVGPRMIETGAMMGGEESGGFGFGMHLPERDGIYADLLLLDLFLRERGCGPLAGLEGDRPPPRDRRAVVLPARRRPRRPRRLPSAQGPTAGRPAAQRADDARRSAGRHEPMRSRPTTASSSSRATARGCSCASAAPSRSSASTPRPARRTPPTRSSAPAKRWSAANDGDRRSRRPRSSSRLRHAAGREALGPRARLGRDRSVRRKDPRDRDRPASLAPVPRAQARVDPRPVGATEAATSRTNRASCGRRSSGPVRADWCPSGGGTASRRSSASSCSRSRARSSTTSSGWRTTSVARARQRRPALSRDVRTPAEGWLRGCRVRARATAITGRQVQTGRRTSMTRRVATEVPARCTAL